MSWYHFQKDIGKLVTYRKIFEETPNIEAVYDWMQWLIGSVVLTKLAKLWYNTNLHLQRECIIMGSELLAAPFRVIMFHPQEKIDNCEYRMKEFLPDIGLLSDKQTLQLVDLLSGLDIISEMLINYKMYERVLPLAILMNYTATDIVKSTPYMIKARVLKGVVLSCLGYLSQALNWFYQISENKDKISSVLNTSKFYTQTKEVRLSLETQNIYTETNFHLNMKQTLYK